MILIDAKSFSIPTYSSFFFFNDTATTEIYTLSLHDALPISRRTSVVRRLPGSEYPVSIPSQKPPRRPSPLLVARVPEVPAKPAPLLTSRCWSLCLFQQKLAVCRHAVGGSRHLTTGHRPAVFEPCSRGVGTNVLLLTGVTAGLN